MTQSVPPISALSAAALPVVVIAVEDAAGARACSTGTVTYGSLDPPLVVVALGPSSRTYAAAQSMRRFSVSVLSEDQVQIAVDAGKPSASADKFTERSIPEVRHPDRSDPGVSGAAAVLWCDLETTAECGDHVLCVGRIVCSTAVAEPAPLIRLGGEYRTTGQALAIDEVEHYPL
jgi:flavin reductase (DIM6/NTAB) family NADH-FMN oxidoreductase RutF